MKRIAIFPASGIGDALLLMIAAFHYQQQGIQVDVYHDTITQLSPWFPSLRLHPLSPNIPYDNYDFLIVENDNSPKISQLIATQRDKLQLIYPTYSAGKHAPLHPLDRVFDPTLSMAANLATHSKHNGITPPSGLYSRIYEKRVLIHPTSKLPQKNWTASSFVKLSQKLRHHGFFPHFVVSPQEKQDWEWIQQEQLPLVTPNTLSDLAALIYESGYLIGNDSAAGHLASNLGIPTLIIANDPKRLRLWRPDWEKSTLVFPPAYLPNFKGFRLKDHHWQSWIRPQKVLNSFLRFLF